MLMTVIGWVLLGFVAGFVTSRDVENTTKKSSTLKTIPIASVRSTRRGEG
jgi:hypothetical protein